MPRLTINGETREEEAYTVGALLDRLGVPWDRLVVELNRRVLNPDEYEAEDLEDGDEIELVRFVGGG